MILTLETALIQDISEIVNGVRRQRAVNDYFM